MSLEIFLLPYDLSTSLLDLLKLQETQVLEVPVGKCQFDQGYCDESIEQS